MDTKELRADAEKYMEYLRKEEKSAGTLRQYRHDILQFLNWLEQQAELGKETTIGWKEKLQRDYQPCTVNAKLAALNSFLSYEEHEELKVRQLKIQRQTYCSREKELTQAEYERLVKAARERGDERLEYLIQTICATGIRVSELQYIKTLQAGDLVTFTGVDGISIAYEVAAVETLQPTQIAEMIQSSYDLTMYTCTYGGASRVTVRCNRIAQSP